MIDDGAKRTFDEQGYLVARGLFDAEQAAFLREHFMRLREAGAYPGDVVGVDPSSDDPLKKYPRMIHMHRWDAVALDWLIEPRLAQSLASLLGGMEPFAVQTMLYFKPPGARGQAVHQDQYYLRAEPGTCIAAWMALDSCDEENGCLEVVPGSHEWPVLCTIGADTNQSFTDVEVPLSDDAELVRVLMEPGDVLFFNGSLVHGSKPNRSDRFRRALIGHYIQGDAREVGYWYHPVLRMDGSEVELEKGLGGGPCGEWVDRDGRRAIELTGVAVDPRTTE
ncbi:MAG TPA: phytanoyl-CoA dioxygenase family protein [Gaiellaceae bacterium]|nr:phytanoyl-CoA dioxygenase family protein [Gaiellaceae bacterium]